MLIFNNFRFKDQAVFGYGTSIPPNNNEVPEDNDVVPKRVIFCVHGKLSGCCTVVKGLDENSPADYQQNAAHRKQFSQFKAMWNIDRARAKLFFSWVST